MTRALIPWVNTLKATALILMVLAPTDAHPQLACGGRANMVERLNQAYGEAQEGFGLSSPGVVIELWVSNESPYTWTILKTYPNGVSCILAAGEYWRELTPDYATPTGREVHPLTRSRTP